jgi:heat shock protein HslJ
MKLQSTSILFLSIIILTSCEPTLIQNGKADASKTTLVSTLSITDKTWKINLVNLEKIEGDSKDYFLKLDSTSKQFQAKAGCNQIFGEFEIKDNMISFSKIGLTKMYCFDTMKYEDALLSVLSNSSKIVIVDTTKFILLNDDIVIAQFELVK